MAQKQPKVMIDHVQRRAGSSKSGTSSVPGGREVPEVTIIWFIVWLIANNVGGHEPLLFNPVNAWTATLIVAIALDLSASHAQGSKKYRR